MITMIRVDFLGLQACRFPGDDMSMAIRLCIAGLSHLRYSSIDN